MKIVAVEISCEAQVEGEVEGEVPVERAVAAASNESFQFALTTEITHDTPAGPVVEALLPEILRRYQNLNARKTN